MFDDPLHKRPLPATPTCYRSLRYILISVLTLASSLPFFLDPENFVQGVDKLAFWQSEEWESTGGTKLEQNDHLVATILEDKAENKPHIFDQSAPHPKPTTSNSSITVNSAQPASSPNSTYDPTDSTTSTCEMPPPPSYPLISPSEHDNIPSVLLDYISFHKQARACLLSATCHPKPKVIISRCPRKRCLGLGDRMIGMPFALSVAIVTKRVFFINFSPKPYPLHAGMVPAAIDWTLPKGLTMNGSMPFLEWYWCNSGNPARVCAGSSPAASNLPGFVNEAGQNEELDFLHGDVRNMFADRQVVTLASRVDLKQLGYLESNPFLKDTYAELGGRMISGEVNVFKLLFQPSDETKRHMKSVEFGGEYFGAHVRNGVDSHETGRDRFQYLSTHEEEIVDNILTCFTSLRRIKNITKIFLASDSQTTKKYFLEKGPQLGFDVKTFDGEILHYGKSHSYDRGCDSFLIVFADLFMLGHAEVLVRTGSNLANFAARLGGRRASEYDPVKDVAEACQPR